jgi:hypothetical protein
MGAGRSILRGISDVVFLIAFLIPEVPRLSVSLTIGNAQAAPKRSICPTTASAAGRPKTTSAIAPKAARPPYTAIVLPGPLVLFVRGNLAE